MPAIYKSLAKANGEKNNAKSDALKKNRQRVLILSSRGVTYRFVYREGKRGYCQAARMGKFQNEGHTNITDTVIL